MNSSTNSGMESWVEDVTVFLVQYVTSTCVHNSLDLDARVVQLFGEGVYSLQQIFASLRVNVGPPCGDLNCRRVYTQEYIDKHFFIDSVK